MDHTNVSPVGDERVSQEMLDAMESALRLKSFRIVAGGELSEIWKELYSNEEYHDKIIDKDVQRTLKVRKQDKDKGPVRPARTIPYEVRKKNLMKNLGLL